MNLWLGIASRLLTYVALNAVNRDQMGQRNLSQLLSDHVLSPLIGIWERTSYNQSEVAKEVKRLTLAGAQTDAQMDAGESGRLIPYTLTDTFSSTLPLIYTTLQPWMGCRRFRRLSRWTESSRGSRALSPTRIRRSGSGP